MYVFVIAASLLKEKRKYSDFSWKKNGLFRVLWQHVSGEKHAEIIKGFFGVMGRRVPLRFRRGFDGLARSFY